MARFLKRWWLEDEFTLEDGSTVLFKGWINTTHECKSRKDIPTTISGSYWISGSEGKLYSGKVILDDTFSCECDDSNKYVMVKNIEVTHKSANYNKENYYEVSGFNTYYTKPKKFYFKNRIESAVKYNKSSIDVLNDGWSKLNYILENGNSDDPFKFGDISIATYNKCKKIKHLNDLLEDLYTNINVIRIYNYRNISYSINILFKEYINVYLDLINASFADQDDIDINELISVNGYTYINTLLKACCEYKDNKNGIITDLFDENKSRSGPIYELKDMDIQAIIDELRNKFHIFFSENF